MISHTNPLYSNEETVKKFKESIHSHLGDLNDEGFLDWVYNNVKGNYL